MGDGLRAEPRLARSGTPAKAGIVHLGPGAFFRAFNAAYTHDAMAAAGGDWGITAVSLRSPTARDQLQPQGGAFTSVTLGPEGSSHQVIESVVGVMVAPEDPVAVIAAMADPAIRIVSLTVTEKGYCHNPATGQLNPDHPDVVHDLGNRGAPRSAPGLIVAALAQRRAAGIGPFTVLSCDNLPANGALIKGIVIDFARKVDPTLAEWIEIHVPFPATMVDRITPATTQADIERLAESAGYVDPGCVVHEPFRQWVIEDRFATGRPDWDVVGAQFVQDVAAHEHMKLRCLNGTHSALAYLGYLAGYDTIAETVADPTFASYCQTLWREEILPTVPTPEGEDLVRYCNGLLARYRNPAIRHRTWQIAMDGSQKLPQRLLGTIGDRLATGSVPVGLCLAVAGWMRYVGGVDEAGQRIDVRDPLADELKAIASSATSAAGKVDALVAVRDVFEPDLAKDRAFRDMLVDVYGELERDGARAAVAARG
ncbi:MAG: mannitol dehydrogenase family protein [Pseudomonadota bacterium]